MSAEFVFDAKAAKKEINAMKKIFAEAIKEDEAKGKIIIALIEEAGFMRAAMKECKRQMFENGIATEVVNASQHYMKEHPCAKVYNDNVRQYKEYIKALGEYLPKKERKSALIELMSSV